VTRLAILAAFTAMLAGCMTAQDCQAICQPCGVHYYAGNMCQCRPCCSQPTEAAK
jgi:hypothetical protein